VLKGVCGGRVSAGIFIVTDQGVNQQRKAFKFNPGFQSDEEAIQNFIVRKDEFDRITGAFLGKEKTTGPRVLVVAPRGAGKSTLCRRVLAEVRRSADLSAKWHPIFLGEESYSVTTPGEFFLECVFHLQDQMPDAGLQSDYEEALQIEDEQKLLSRVLVILKQFSQKKRKRLLIIFENFQVILDDQIGDGAKELLRHLKDEQFFGVLATSVAQFDDANKNTRPTGFLEIQLKPLSLNECHELWKSLTNNDVKLERIRPLQILTGGSPRLLHILADFMRTPSLRSLMDNLNLLIDQNTEYFKSQLDALPSIERKVFAALLDAWDPCTAKQISETARVTTNVASAMLLRLTARGSVIKEQGKGRTALYYAAERLFNIYYLMRRRSHPSSRVRALVSFMTEYYDRDELVDTAAILAREACTVRPDNRVDYHSTFDAILSRAPTAVRARILAQAPADFMSSFQEHWKTEHGGAAMIEEPSQSDSGADVSSIRPALERSGRAMEREDYDEASRIILEALESNPNSAPLLLRHGLLLQQKGKYDELLEVAQRLRKVDSKREWADILEGLAHLGTDKTDDAKRSFESALAIDEENTAALNELAVLYDDEDDTERAMALYERAWKGETLYDATASRYASLLIERKDELKAEAVLRSELEKPDSYLSRRSLVDLLARTSREDEGIDILRKSAKSIDTWQSWADLGTYLLATRTDILDAKAALERSVALGAPVPLLFRFYAQAILESGGSSQDVEQVAADVTTRLATAPEAWIAAANIHLMVEQFARAEDAYRKAIELSDGPEVCRASRELAELLVHNGDDTAAKLVLKDALERNSECYCCNVVQGEMAGRHGDNEGARRCFKTALDLNAEGINALTGLARHSSRDEAKQFIERAIKAGPNDSRVLLARAHLNDSDPKSQIADANQALDKNPRFIEARLFLMPILAKQGDIELAISHLKAALDELPKRRELIPMLVDAAMAVASEGGGERVSELIEAHPFASSIEPLTVALKLKRGEKPIVAKEILAVAEDIAESGKKAERK
jgi:tetratricopeptide (TPR) repeat protein